MRMAALWCGLAELRNAYRLTSSWSVLCCDSDYLRAHNRYGSGELFMAKVGKSEVLQFARTFALLNPVVANDSGNSIRPAGLTHRKRRDRAPSGPPDAHHRSHSVHPEGRRPRSSRNPESCAPDRDSPGNGRSQARFVAAHAVLSKTPLELTFSETCRIRNIRHSNPSAET